MVMVLLLVLLVLVSVGVGVGVGVGGVSSGEKGLRGKTDVFAIVTPSHTYTNTRITHTYLDERKRETERERERQRETERDRERQRSYLNDGGVAYLMVTLFIEALTKLFASMPTSSVFSNTRPRIVSTRSCINPRMKADLMMSSCVNL